MGGYFKFFIFCMCVLQIYGQRTDRPIVCWISKWFNTFSPTETNRSDYEHQSAKVLDSICIAGSPIAAQCKDQKGESFSGYKNDTVSKFIATCNVALGLICNPYNTTTNETCPDYQIQYGCKCQKTTTQRHGFQVTIGGGTTQTNTAVNTLKNGSGSGGGSGSGSGNSGSKTTGIGSGQSTPGQQQGQDGNSGQNYGFSQIMLLSCIILAIFC